MADQYNPNLGALSALQGMGSAISDVGKIGLLDALETRRVDVEHGLRAKLKGEEQEFQVEQATTADDRSVEAATVKHGRDMELQGLKNKKPSDSGGVEKQGIYQKAGVTISASDMTDRYEAFYGLNSDAFMMPEGGIPSQDEWAKKEGWTLLGTQPPKPVILSEEDYKTRYFAQFPDATEQEFMEDLSRDTKAGNVKAGNKPAAAAEPGIMDAMAAESGGAADEFAGGMAQAEPGALSQTEQIAQPTPYEQMGQSMQQSKQLKDRLMKHKSETSTGSSRGTRKQSRNNSAKIQKAAKQVEAALKKGNIRTVGKDRIKLALNNPLFVGNLSAEELQTLIDYLEQR